MGTAFDGAVPRIQLLWRCQNWRRTLSINFTYSIHGACERIYIGGQGAEAAEQLFRRLVWPLQWDGNAISVGSSHGRGINPDVGNGSATMVGDNNIPLDAPTSVRVDNDWRKGTHRV
jgi:hypothetical protein